MSTDVQNSARVDKVKKAAPKKGKKGAAEAEPLTAEALAAIPLFASLEPALLGRLIGRVTPVDVARGEDLFSGRPALDEVSPVFVVVSGDVSVHRTTQGGAEEVVNFLRPGEAYVQKLFADARTEKLRLTSMVPVKALRLGYSDVNYILKKNARFRDDFSAAIVEVTERQRRRFDNGLQQDIARFFVEQRLTFAGRVKIKRMDICIECDGCYEACKERHGTDRLGASEVKYGLTEIPQNCHACAVPECLDKCKFGHLSVHPQTREIVIADDCTGCTMCSRGCSFGAIRMHSLADLDVAKYFPDRSPDAKGKNIAQKCDNCTGYPDQACITACPTGALFQVDGSRLFEYWQQFTVHKGSGQGTVAAPDEVPRGWRRFWIAFTLLNVLVLTWECLTRTFRVEASLGALFHRLGWTETALEPGMALRAGDWFSHALGYIGAGLLLGTQLYRIGKRVAPRLGSVVGWMESHVFLGLLGGIYGLFHTALDFRDPVSITAFVTMSLAIGTGVVGRYVLFLVPRSGAGKQLALDELDQRIAALHREIEGRFDDPRAGMTVIHRVQKLTAEATAADAEGAPAGGRLVAGVARLVREARAQRRHIAALRAELEAGGVTGARAEAVLGLLVEKARLERSVRRHAFLARVLKRYRVVHVVASNVMFGALLLHIVWTLTYSVGN